MERTHLQLKLEELYEKREMMDLFMDHQEEIEEVNDSNPLVSGLTMMMNFVNKSSKDKLDERIKMVEDKIIEEGMISPIF